MAGIHTRWESLNDGGLRIEWKLGGLARVLRFSVGIPILLAGLVFTIIVISNIGILAAGGGRDLIGGTIISLTFAMMLLPLGWWMVMSRSHIRITPDGQSVSEIIDWRLGKKEKTVPLAEFEFVKVSVEELNPGTSHRDESGAPAMGIRVALQPGESGKTPPVELGWFEPVRDQLPRVRDFLFVVNSTTGLFVEDELEQWFGEE